MNPTKPPLESFDLRQRPPLSSFRRQTPQEAGGFRYNVKPDFKTQLGLAKQNAQQAQVEAQRANSPLGMAGKFGKNVVSTLANSEAGLGKTLGGIIGTNLYSDEFSQANTKNNQTLIQYQKLIRDYEAQGKDTTNLKRGYNAVANQIGQAKQDYADITAPTQKTTGQVAGELGGTALDILTAGTYGRAKTAGMGSFNLSRKSAPVMKNLATSAGIPELGNIATQKASGLFTKKGLANVATGAGVGYGFDVTQGLQGARGEDRTGAKAFIPGLGTLIGGGIPAVSEGTQSVKNALNPEVRSNNLITKRRVELDKLDRLQPLKRAVEKGRERGIDVKKILSETDVMHGSVDKTGKITTKGEGGAVEQYTKQFIDGNESLVSEALKKEGVSIAPQLVEKKLKEAISKAGIEGSALIQAENKINKELAGYARRAGENGAIPLSTLHDAKIDKYTNINFMTDLQKQKYDKAVGKALKELVEDHTKSVDVRNINRELSKHFAVIDYLNKLDGKIVEGGKLGKYFARTVGAIVGSHFGALGAIAGAEAGGRLKGSLMSKVFSGKTGKTAQQAKPILDAIRYKKERPLQLHSSGSLNKLGNLNQSQSPTIIKTSSPGTPTNIPFLKKKTTQYDTPEIEKARSEQSFQKETIHIKTPERSSLKKEISKKLYGNGAKNKNRRADIVMGLPASGKSTGVVEPLSKEHGSLIIDADMAKEMLPEFQGGRFAGAVHKESALIIEKGILRKAIRTGDNIVLPIVGKNSKKVEKEIVDRLKKKGYSVNLHFVDLPPEKAAQRAVERFKKTGRFVDPHYILNDVGLRPSETYDKLKANEKLTSTIKYSTDVAKGNRPQIIEKR